jgi:hypothetical protein
MESQKECRRRSECLVGMDSVVAVIGIFCLFLDFNLCILLADKSGLKAPAAAASSLHSVDLH